MQLILILFTTIWIYTDATSFGHRKDVKYLTENEKQELLETLYLMKTEQSRYNASISAYDYFPWVHAVSVRIIKSHRTWAFLPWHRAFLYFFEDEINFYMQRPTDNPFKLPYWNPTDDISTEKTLFDTDFLGGSGDPTTDPPYLVPDEYAMGGNKFPLRDGFGFLDVGTFSVNPSFNTSYNYPSLARWIFEGTADPGKGIICAKELEEKKMWDILYETSVYDIEPYNDTEEIWNVSHCSKSLRSQLEGCNPYNYTFGCSIRHSTLHRSIGGHQMALPWSPNDPLFFMLHGWIDYVWAQWQDIHDTNFDNFPQHLLDEQLFDFGDFNNDQISSRDVLNTRDLLYRYDIQDLSHEDEKGWYEDFEKPWVYLFILAILLVLVAIGWFIL
eukprot:257164_1